MSEELENEKASVSRLQNEVEKWREENSLLRSDLRGLQSELEDAQAECNMLKQPLSEKEVNFRALQANLGKEQQARQRLEEELLQSRRTCAELERSLENERLLSQSNQQAAQTKDETIREQMRQLEQERELKLGLQVEVGEERIRRISTERELLQERNLLEQNRENLERERETYEQRIRERERTLVDSERRLGELQSALSVAQEALAEYRRLEPRDWIIRRDEVIISKIALGTGAWGNVYQGSFRGLKSLFAKFSAKVLLLSQASLFCQLFHLLSLCQHSLNPNSTMTDLRMNKVKGKLQGIKDKIEKAEDREASANEQLREVTEEANKNEGEADSFRRRIVLVKDELAKISETLEEKTTRVNEVKRVAVEHENACKELEVIDRDSDERITALEETLQESIGTAKESEERLVEAKQKLKVILTEVEKARERAEILEGKANDLEDSISDIGNRLRQKESEDTASAENEMDLNDKLMFVKTQLDDAIARAEEAERKLQPQEIIIDDLTQERDALESKINLIKQEFQKMQEMVDESMDDVESIEPKSVADRYREIADEDAEAEPGPSPEDE
ncbi:PREDICTED: golgin subfamily A member 6-like protein 22 [Acropora digitifera]|uniref:golgin subfamily A member 6-like protein 22 n=2 Tax=Acropora TaxID=6127 RepID=UPI00077B101B|nr:PREDICTED: golgin subfamily A member 6-like protein 22 [Acropora digitifera]